MSKNRRFSEKERERERETKSKNHDESRRRRRRRRRRGSDVGWRTYGILSLALTFFDARPSAKELLRMLVFIFVIS